MPEPSAPAVAYLALGSNLQNPLEQLRAATPLLNSLPATRLDTCSSPYRSTALGYHDQPDFINAVVRIHTRLDPNALLTALIALEHRLGRERSFRNAPRTIDLDILLYNQHQQQDDFLTLPHPRMHLRAFVLLPLLEIAPDIEIPGQGAAHHWLGSVADQTIERLEATLIQP